MKDEDEAVVAQASPTEAPETGAADWKKEIADAFEESIAADKPIGEPDAVEAPPVAEAVADEEVAVDSEGEPDEPEGAQGRDTKGQFTRKAPLSDALLERAVKAGIPMGEARQFQSEALLGATCARLEGVQKGVAGEAKPAGDKKGKDGEAGPAAADPVSAIDAIPDLNPEVYDAQIVKAFGAVKEIARSQAKELAELRGKGSKNFLATQLEGVKEFTKGDQSKETAVRAKFDTLKAGYKATGQDVSDVTVFAEAAQLVLGSDMKAAAKQNKVEAAGRRSAQRISRAAGQRVEAKPDPVEAVVEKIQARYFT